MASPIKAGSATTQLIRPYGGDLVDLVASRDELNDLKAFAESLPSLRLSPRSVCDLELLATGAFSPVDRFLGEADYRRVLHEMRLVDGHIFSIPVVLAVDHGFDIAAKGPVVLRDYKNDPMAVMTIEECFPWDRTEYARKVLGTTSVRHPLASEIASWGDRLVSGPMRVFNLPRYFDFPDLRLTPRDVRHRLATLGNPNVVAFQTRNPLHRAHEEMTKRAMDEADAVLLMHPVVGMTKAGDLDHHCRVRAYKVLIERYYDPNSTVLALLPLAMRFAGPREAVWHAIIRRNYGANHFIVGRDHASPGVDENGHPFYEPYAAQRLVESLSDEIGVKAVSFEELVYLPDEDRYVERSKVPNKKPFRSMSGSLMRNQYLDDGRPLPEWFVRPEIDRLLRDTVPPRDRQGICVWFTGLSGSGKSTTAEILAAMLPAFGRRVTVLDGDVVRTNLSAGLSFDKVGRDANVRRIGFVASEIVRHGGVAICAAISPYRQTRNEVRKMFGPNFIEVFVSTPLDVCEQRDPKGMYQKARRGEIRSFTGIDDVYEEPITPEIVLDTVERTADENARLIIRLLHGRGLLCLGDRDEPDSEDV